MNQFSIDYEKTLSIWWSWLWRAFIFSVIFGGLLGGIGGFVVGFAGHPEAASSVGGLMGWLASIPVSIWALKAALSKKHKGYSVRLVTESAPANTPQA